MGYTTALNPLAFLATSAALLGVVLQACDALIGGADDNSLVMNILHWLEPYALFALFGLFAHLSLRRKRARSSVAMALYAGAGPATMCGPVSILLVTALRLEMHQPTGSLFATVAPWMRLLLARAAWRPRVKQDSMLPLPEELMEVLQWHVDRLPDGLMKSSELLFPSETGEFRACSCLDRPFDEVASALGLNKKITPRAMRRTFQDLARAAEVKDVVTRAVSGHATEAMQRHYSTVSAIEMKTSLAKVIDLAGIRKALAA